MPMGWKPKEPFYSDYSSLVAQAKKAASSVKDPELRYVAFQKVLEDLVSRAHYLSFFRHIEYLHEYLHTRRVQVDGNIKRR